MDLKLGPQMHLSAESQSDGTMQLVPEPRKMAILLHGAEEEHGKECPWQLDVVSESAEYEEGCFII